MSFYSCERVGFTWFHSRQALHQLDMVGCIAQDTMRGAGATISLATTMHAHICFIFTACIQPHSYLFFYMITYACKCSICRCAHGRCFMVLVIKHDQTNDHCVRFWQRVGEHIRLSSGSFWFSKDSYRLQSEREKRLLAESGVNWTIHRTSLSVTDNLAPLDWGAAIWPTLLQFWTRKFAHIALHRVVAVLIQRRRPDTKPVWSSMFPQLKDGKHHLNMAFEFTKALQLQFTISFRHSWKTSLPQYFSGIFRLLGVSCAKA